MKVITHNMRVQFQKKLGNYGVFPWMGTCFVMTPDECAKWPNEPKAIVNQDCTMLSGDGTQQSRKAAHDAELAKCVPLTDGEHVMIEGREYVAKYIGDYSDTFHFIPVVRVVGDVWKDGSKWKLKCSKHIETFLTKRAAVAFLADSRAANAEWVK